ncbi:MAG: hypothetical protein IT317_18980 [Anaerolineales bacterium]|nr:hypothetical protein [Anaerolineales bacterium]
MNTFRRSLRALGHPASLAAIGLLLLNDHVLKAAYPSWVTGKLSDFAGLFFFPFLLIAIGAFPARSLGQDQARSWLPRAAFGLTAVWFAAIKLWPAANAAMEALLGWVLRARVAIAPDPTDVMALVVLWPAWGLWRRVGRPELERLAARSLPFGWKGGAALILAAVATIATSPCAPPVKVMRVTEVDGTLYALLTDAYGSNALAESSDGGRNWAQVAELPGAVATRFQEAIVYPRVACSPEDPRHCFRVAATEQVEESRDGGSTWGVAWQVPAGRRAFMERWLSQPLSCGADVRMEMGPYDLAFFREPAGTTLAVAMGGQGVLVRTAAGEWERLAVLQASPVPFSGGGIFVLLPEVVWSLVASLLVVLGLTWLAWQKVLADNTAGWDLVLSRAWVVIAGIGVFVLSLLSVGSLGTAALGGMGVGVVLVLIGLLLAWGRAASVAVLPDNVWGMAAVTAAAAVLIGPAAIGLFSAWVAGSIAVYETALGMAAGIAAAVLAGSVALIVRLAKGAGA